LAVLPLALLLGACQGAAAPAPKAAARAAPRYALNEPALSASEELAFDAAGRAALERALTDTFGTPERPRYLVLAEWREQGFDPNAWPEESPEPSADLAESAALFRARCARCHGISGGGDGPMASRLRTRPRDYRRGAFKKTPLSDRARPRHEDLVRTLEEGIADTAMPSWGPRLSSAEIAGLADYVRLLAIRGETERMAIFDFDAERGLDPAAFREAYALAVERWRTGGEHVIPTGAAPPSTPERIARGRALFHEPGGANCVRCHGSEGHGDGEASRVLDPLTGESVPFRDEWGNPIRPRDLVCAPYRFGSDPEDLYRRVFAGINGTPMPAHSGLLQEEDIWDLVLYVRSLQR
jgi:mono/diheme cytochrome c family protein